MWFEDGLRDLSTFAILALSASVFQCAEIKEFYV